MRAPIPTAILLLLVTGLAPSSPGTASDAVGSGISPFAGFAAAPCLTPDAAPDAAPDATAGIAIPDTAYTGPTRVAACDTLRLPFFNAGSGEVIVDSISIDPAGTGIGLLPPPGSPPYLVIPAGSTTIVTLLHCPTDTGCGDVAVRVAYREGAVAGSHTIHVRACGGAPDGVVDTAAIELGRTAPGRPVSRTIAVANHGAFPLRIDAIRLRGTAFTATPPAPVIVLPGRTEEITIHLAASVPGEFRDTLTFGSDSWTPLPPIPIHAIVRGTTIALSGKLDLGTILFGGCVDTAIVVRNNGDEPAILSAVELALPPGAPAAALRIGRAEPPDSTIPAGAADTLLLRICADTVGTWAGAVAVTIGGDTLRVPIAWTVPVPSIRLDTAEIEPGRIATLHAMLDGIAPGEVNIRSYTLRIVFDPESLFPKRIVAGSGERDVDYGFDGTLLISGSALLHGTSAEGASAEGTSAELCSVDLRGLSTGLARNTVAITEATIAGAGALAARGDGLVYLEGCDVARRLVVGRKLAIRSISRRDGRLLLGYTAPSGSRPFVRLHDITGRRLAEIRLEAAYADEPGIALPVEVPAAGIYIIELIGDDARDALLVPILPQ